MMKKYFLLILFFTGFTRIAGQDISRVRYRDMIFKSVSITSNQSYRAAGMAKAKSRDYLIDIYQPKNDSKTGRPLIIWIHGGGFKFGHKRTRGTPIWSKSFARRGYVCLAMNYRRSKRNPLGNFREMLSSCYNAMEDLNNLVVWSKRNAAALGIDTNRIILAGNSAGGMIALQSAYSSLNNMAVIAKRSDSLTAVKTINQNNAVAVINFWGAVFDSTWLRNAKVPIVSAHGTLDRVVPFDHLIVPVFGSAVIHRQADSLHVPNSLKAYEGFTHELQRPFHPIFYSKKAKNRWLEAGQFAADFLYDKVIKN